MKKMIAVLLASSMMVSGFAQAAAASQPSDQGSSPQPAAVAGAATASSAYSGGVTAATVVGVGIVVAAVALIAVGSNRNGHTTGTTGTH